VGFHPYRQGNASAPVVFGISTDNQQTQLFQDLKSDFSFLEMMVAQTVDKYLASYGTPTSYPRQACILSDINRGSATKQYTPVLYTPQTTYKNYDCRPQITSLTANHGR
jgi:hypothetical protein